MKQCCKDLSYNLNQLRRRINFAERMAKLGYWELNLEEKKFFWSDEMYRIFGVKANNNSYKHNLIKEHIYQDDLPIYKYQLQKIIKNLEPVEGVVRVIENSGEIKYCIFKADLLLRKKQKVIIGILQDVSKWIYKQNELEVANIQKNFFLAQASHDLRQPMQALQLQVDAMDEKELSAVNRSNLYKIKDSISHLRKLLDNFLDISKLDSGGIVPQYHEFELQDLFCVVCREYHFCFDAQISCKVMNKKIKNDALLLERIVRNLLNNAMKYTKGKILLSVRVKHQELIVRIIDNGCGIAKDEQNLIFNDFYQSNKIINNRSNGAGLGLGIVLRIVKLLKGNIKLRSKLNAYTAFEIRLPLING